MLKINETDRKNVIEAMALHDQGLFGLIERDKYFETKVPYARREDFPIRCICETCGSKIKSESAEADFKEAREKYNKDHNRLLMVFRFAALYEVGLIDRKGNPSGNFEQKKVEKAFDMAWDRGHSSGLYEVMQNLGELAQLLKD